MSIKRLLKKKKTQAWGKKTKTSSKICTKLLRGQINIHCTIIKYQLESVNSIMREKIKSKINLIMISNHKKGVSRV